VALESGSADPLIPFRRFEEEEESDEAEDGGFEEEARLMADDGRACAKGYFAWFDRGRPFIKAGVDGPGEEDDEEKEGIIPGFGLISLDGYGPEFACSGLTADDDDDEAAAGSCCPLMAWKGLISSGALTPEYELAAPLFRIGVETGVPDIGCAYACIAEGRALGVDAAGPGSEVGGLACTPLRAFSACCKQAKQSRRIS